MPDVRYLTTMRDPISQALSWESMQINRGYYLDYPAQKCNHRPHIEINLHRWGPAQLRHKLGTVHNCIATEYRKNLTMMLVAHTVNSWPASQEGQNGRPGDAVALTAEWIMGAPKPAYHDLAPDAVVEVLKREFFLVAPVERMSEFLVLIGLHMGWKYEALHYVSCKPQDLDVHRSEFQGYFPELAAKLVRATLPMMEAYKWVESDWEGHVKRLGPWFKEEVEKFQRGLAVYQKKHKHVYRYRWASYVYLDGHNENC
jgi:hypothetical protein